MTFKFYEGGYDSDKKYVLYKVVKMDNKIQEYYRELIIKENLDDKINNLKTKIEDLSATVDLSQQALDTLILNQTGGGE